MRFSALERKFGEIDRARAIYVHISQFADPRGDVLKLWTVILFLNFIENSNIKKYRFGKILKRTMEILIHIKST